ncbi:MAG: hypothetical protein HYY97_00860 [Rhodocyclales bacterium]|nr:hypothetical protein [Rhodocyclales bacterium]
MLKRLLVSSAIAAITGTVALANSNALAHSAPIALSLMLAPGMFLAAAIEAFFQVKNFALFYLAYWGGQFAFWFVVVSILADIRQSREESTVGSRNPTRQ